MKSFTSVTPSLLKSVGELTFEVPNAGANIMKSFTSVIPLLFKSVGQDATTFMVPVALTLPQPPVKGIE